MQRYSPTRVRGLSSIAGIAATFHMTSAVSPFPAEFSGGRTSLARAAPRTAFSPSNATDVRSLMEHYGAGAVTEFGSRKSDAPRPAQCATIVCEMLPIVAADERRNAERAREPKTAEDDRGRVDVFGKHFPRRVIRRATPRASLLSARRASARIGALGIK